jgi:hypothetical protein
MLVTFEPRAAAPGIPRQCTTCSLERRLDFLGDCLARCGPGKSLPRVMGGGGLSGDWPVSTDPSVHVEALNKLFDSGVTIVNVHSHQPNQQKGIEFHANNVPPSFRNRSQSDCNPCDFGEN